MLSEFEQPHIKAIFSFYSGLTAFSSTESFLLDNTAEMKLKCGRLSERREEHG